MNSRRLICASVRITDRIGSKRHREWATDVHFGSKADICAAKSHVRFAPATSNATYGMSAKRQKRTLPLYSITSSARASSNGGGNANTSWYCETERDRQPRPKRGIKFLIAADRDLTATRAAALDLQQADELARVFAKSNTKRPTCSADLVRSPDTSRSSL